MIKYLTSKSMNKNLIIECDNEKEFWGVLDKINGNRTGYHWCANQPQSLNIGSEGEIEGYSKSSFYREEPEYKDFTFTTAKKVLNITNKPMKKKDKKTYQVTVEKKKTIKITRPKYRLNTEYYIDMMAQKEQERYTPRSYVFCFSFWSYSCNENVYKAHTGMEIKESYINKNLIK